MCPPSLGSQFEPKLGAKLGLLVYEFLMIIYVSFGRVLAAEMVYEKLLFIRMSFVNLCSIQGILIRPKCCSFLIPPTLLIIRVEIKLLPRILAKN